MIFDGVPYKETLSDSTHILNRSLLAFTDLLEKNLGVKIVKDLAEIPFSRHDLAEPLKIAELLKNHGIIRFFAPTPEYPDLPQLRNWYAICNDVTSHHVGGTTWDDDKSALYATLSEAIERYIWMTQDDYFVNPTKATEEEIAKIGPYVAPHTFAAFSDEQRASRPELVLRPDAEYLWIEGTSITRGVPVYIPAQIVTGIRPKNLRGAVREPLIRQQITNGLATWPTQAGARLGGILELIEREAYMIMWLNQMTLPRFALPSLSARYPSLSKVFAKCEKYRFKPHVLQLPTDAPAHAVAVIMEDLSDNAPHFTIGLKTHTSLSTAVEKAMSEALRAKHIHRSWIQAGNSWDTNTPVEKIGHYERLYYWGVPENAKNLEFLIKGPEINVENKSWDNNSIEEHLQKVIQWCEEKDFDCISVPLTSSSKNPTSLHIEMMVIPQLQPTYLNEASQQLGGARWRDVPKALGYTPLKKPFADRPHPFL